METILWQDTLLMEYTTILAWKSICQKMKFGATIVKDGTIIASGTNHPWDRRVCEPCLRQNPTLICIHPYEEVNAKIKSGTHLEICKAIHAEQDALLYALRHQIDIKGGLMYVAGEYLDGKPFLIEHKGFYCTFCARLIHDSGLMGVKVRTADGIALLNLDEVMESAYKVALKQ